MNYKAWRQWVRSKPLAFKWLILIILARPIIDILWDLKDPILSLSPLMVVGVLTPALMLVFVLSRQLPKIRYQLTDRYFVYWSVFVLLNALFLAVDYPSIDMIGHILKLTMPIYIYFYFRHFIGSNDDLYGILTTILYSLLFPALMILYEIFINPIKQISTRGIVRHEGLYADVLSYGTYFIGLIFISCYFWLMRDAKSVLQKKHRYRFFFIFGICLLAMLKTNHTTTYGVFVGVLTLFLIYLVRRGLKILVLMMALGFLVFFIIQTEIEESVIPLVAGEVKVLQGDKEVEHAFHGRMSRWMLHWGHFEEHSLLGRFFGLPVDGLSRVYMTGNGVHSDYLRMIFSFGYLGFFSYLIFLLHIFVRSKGFALSERFLARGVIIIILMYSISTTPLLYYFLNHLSMSVFALVALPKSRTN